MERQCLNYSDFKDTRSIVCEIIQTNTPVGQNLSGIQIFNFSIDSSEMLIPQKTRLRCKVKARHHTAANNDVPLPCLSSEALLSMFSDYREYLAGEQITYLKEPAQSKYVNDILFSSSDEAVNQSVSQPVTVTNVDGDITPELNKDERVYHNNQDVVSCGTGYLECKLPTFLGGSGLSSSDLIIGGVTNASIQLQVAGNYRNRLLNNVYDGLIPIESGVGFDDATVTNTYLFDVETLELIIYKLKKVSPEPNMFRSYMTPQVSQTQFNITSSQQTNYINMVRGCNRIAIYFQSSNIGTWPLGIDGRVRGCNTVTDLSTGICVDGVGASSVLGSDYLLRSLTRCTLRYDGSQYPSVEYNLARGSSTFGGVAIGRYTLEDNRRAYNDFLDQTAAPVRKSSMNTLVRDRTAPQMSFEQWDNSKIFCWNLVTSSGLPAQNASLTLQFSRDPPAFHNAICVVAQYYDKQLDLLMDDQYRTTVKMFATAT
jgi:hypothetical protein